MIKKAIIIFCCLLVISIVTVMVAFFVTTQPLIEDCSIFLTSIVKGNMEKAYKATSEKFRSQYTQQQFSQLAQNLELNRMGHASWRKRKIEGNEGLLEGKIVTDVGKKVFLTIRLVKKKEKWLIDSIKQNKDQKK